ncbi:DUF2243 domain-containing protein [Azospirillum melinis]|uniref:DUF2243 domain-containing protein n=1 Tax=Azospirillum melinis TaxID=328839 RepID=A0ABX2KHA2_9PROT|nr:DUF2243 domain-containing protein [Azospirillum melinis]MBP2307248.1 putative membrane protein [Azospirillum melinis]NUB00644.1 DUF2243 domain-containing protein [Azospirillum melinis]
MIAADPLPHPLPLSDLPRGPGRTLLLGGFSLGFALGGFFDGIMLHQILQWHHLLSGLASPAYADIAVQILADGLFHTLMYLIAAVGLWLLWRGRAGLAIVGGRRLVGWALLGFGVWHMLDGLVSHWLLGLHRIRMDVENKLFWDLLWFFVFGVAVMLAGWLLTRTPSGASGGSGLRRATVPVLLALAVGTAGTVAALPPRGATTALVLFRPDTTPDEALAALATVDGRTVWSDPTGRLWAIDLPGGSTAGLYRHLYRRGALLVGNGVVPAGCLDWFRPAPEQAGPAGIPPAAL